MNAIQLLASQPWVERLGAALLHFLWQGALIAVLYSGARRATRSSGPIVRYILGCVALTLMGIAPVFTFDVMRPAAQATVAMSFDAPVSNGPLTHALQEQLGLRLESARGPVEVIVVDHLEKPTAN